MFSVVSCQFEKFVRFAEERVKAGKDTAIARTGEVTIGKGTPLEERNIYSSDKVDFVGMTLLRTKDAKARMSTSTGFTGRSSAEAPDVYPWVECRGLGQREVKYNFHNL